VDKEVVKLALCWGEWRVLSFSLSRALMERARRNYKNALDTIRFIEFYV